jgi:hypothetical protein
VSRIVIPAIYKAENKTVEFAIELELPDDFVCFFFHSKAALKPK